LHEATQRLADGCESAANMHVLEGTTHSNFTDLCFWLPKSVYGLLQRTPAFGPADPVDAMRQVMNLSSDFMLGVAARRRARGAAGDDEGVISSAHVQ
jgi:hypothetical protein